MSQPIVSASWARVLQWSYPPSWRASGRTQEIVGVVQDHAEATGRHIPELGEVFNAVLHGVLARAKVALVGPASRAHIAQAMIASGLGFALACLLLGEVPLPTYTVLATTPDGTAYVSGCFGPFISLGVITYGLWIAVAISWLVGNRVAIRLVTYGAIFASAVTPLASRFLDLNRPPLTVLGALALMGAGVLLSDRPPAMIRQRAWTVGTGIGVAVVAVANAGPPFITSAFTETGRRSHEFGYLPFFPKSDGRYWFYWNGGGVDLLASRTPWLFAVIAVVLILVGRRPISLATIGLIAAPWSVLFIRAAYIGDIIGPSLVATLLIPTIMLSVGNFCLTRRRWATFAD